MTVCHPTQNVAPASNILAFGQPKRRLDARYSCALANRETKLREALAEVQTLRRQHDEITQLNGGVMDALFAAHDAAAHALASLTPRQHEIMALVLAGRPSKMIAWELGISQRTVENHRASIMHKTDSTSLPALAFLVIAAALNVSGQPTSESRHSAMMMRSASN